MGPSLAARFSPRTGEAPRRTRRQADTGDMSRFARVAAMAFALMLAVPLGGCSGQADTDATTTPASATPRMTVALITHQAPGDTFWDLVRRGAEAAAAKD